MHLKVFTKCQMLCKAYDDMSGFSILNTRGVTIYKGHDRASMSIVDGKNATFFIYSKYHQQNIGIKER